MESPPSAQKIEGLVPGAKTLFIPKPEAQARKEQRASKPDLAAMAQGPGSALAALAAYEGPDREQRLAEGARRLRAQTDRAILGLFGGNLLEMGQFLVRSAGSVGDDGTRWVNDAERESLVLLCGRYEGVDERLIELLAAGGKNLQYVLTVMFVGLVLLKDHPPVPPIRLPLR